MSVAKNVKWKKTDTKFLVFLVSFAILLSVLIYWRENDVQHQVLFLHVVGWQITIWLPWILAFPLFRIINKSLQSYRFRITAFYSVYAVWISIHFAWFFLISNHFSPYLDLPATGYGVYPYFFIFWTSVDIGLLWYVINEVRRDHLDNTRKDPVVFELVRGDKKYFCEPKQVHWLAAENYYTRLYTDQGIFVMRKPLKYFAEQLPENDFQQIHRSTIININQVEQLRSKNDTLQVIMKDGNKRKVSRNYMKKIRSVFRERSF